MQPSIEGVPSSAVVMRSGVGQGKHSLESTRFVKLFHVPLGQGNAEAALQKEPLGLQASKRCMMMSIGDERALGWQ